MNPDAACRGMARQAPRLPAKEPFLFSRSEPVPRGPDGATFQRETVKNEGQ